MKYESKEVGEELHIFTKTELFIVNLLEFFCVLLLFFDNRHLKWN